MTKAIENYLLKLEQHQDLKFSRCVQNDETFEESRKTYSVISNHRKIMETFKKWRHIKSSIEGLKKLAQMEQDPAIVELINGEIAEEKSRGSEEEQELRNLLLEPGEEDKGNAIMEIRAGTGGIEASLFAQEIFAMYERYAIIKGWSFKVRSKAEDGTHGLREATIEIGGGGAFGKLKWESGVHRVQRIPQTESQGRIHTSTVTIAILPQDQAIDIALDENDLRFESFKSSGPGGQHVNKTNSAVRITHLPTGISVAVQEERCAQQNKAKALETLRSRLYQIKRSEMELQRKSSRQSQIGSAARAEKIRTYNFPQCRITDHRLGQSLHDFDSFFAGKCLDNFIDLLVMRSEESKLLLLQ